MKKSIIVSVLLSIASTLSAQVLYRVEGNGLQQPSYLFGTHHLAPLSKIDEFGARGAFEASSQVAGEIDMTVDQMTLVQAMQPFMMAPADSTLSKVISPEDFAIIDKEFSNWTPLPGMNLQAFDTMKPMMISNMVTVAMVSKDMPGYNPEQQLDSYFQKEGKASGKKIVALETPGFQAEVLFNSTPIAYQAEALVELLKEPAKAIEQVRKLNDAYNSQDLKAMIALSEQDNEHPEFMEALLDRRNADWLTKLPSIMSDGSTFIAVGALHLAGDKGIVEGLRKLGYTVTPISAKGAE